jgi:hypothetical protein
MNKLTDVFIKNIKAADIVKKYSDREGLYIHAAPVGTKLWRLAYRFGGKQKTLSLGKYPYIGLKETREQRDKAKTLLAHGIDPGEQRKANKAQALAKRKMQEACFENVAREWFTSYSPDLTPKHAYKLKRCLGTILFPAMGKDLISAITPAEILKVIRPIEAKVH